MNNSELTIVTFKEGGQYVAQALERDFAAQGGTISEALECLAMLLAADAQVRSQLNAVPVPVAPSYYFSMLPATPGDTHG